MFDVEFAAMAIKRKALLVIIYLYIGYKDGNIHETVTFHCERSDKSEKSTREGERKRERE